MSTFVLLSLSAAVAAYMGPVALGPAAGGVRVTSPVVSMAATSPRSPAARSILSKLEALRSTRAVPVDTDGVARLIRSTDALHGEVLLQVLLALKAQRKWELSFALTTMVEAADVVQREAAPPVISRKVAEEVEVDEENEDEEFRRMVADSPNFAGSDTAAAADDVYDDEADYSEFAAALGGDLPVLGVDAARAPPSGGAYAVGSEAALTTMHYNVVLAACAAAGRWSEALDLLARMRRRDVPRDTVTYNTVLSALHKGGRTKLAKDLFEQMRKEKVPPNTVTFATAIASCAAAKDHLRALELLELSLATNTPRNTIVYGAAISACERAGEWQAALDLLERMEAEGVPADSPVLNAAISACGRAGKPDEAERLLGKGFDKHGITPDRISYNALLAALARSLPLAPAASASSGGEAGESDATAEEVSALKAAVKVRMDGVLERMREAGISPDVFSHNSFLNLYARAADGAGAEAHLAEMRSNGVSPDVVSYTSAISAHLADAEAALTLLDQMKADKTVSPGTLAYSKAVAALSAAGEWPRACELLDEMSGDRHLAHNPFTTNLALSACADFADSSPRDGALAASSGLASLRRALQATREATANGLASAPPRNPPCDRATVVLVKRLVAHTEMDEADSISMVSDVEQATLKVRRVKPRGRGGGRTAQGGRGGRGRGVSRTSLSRGRGRSLRSQGAA